MNYDIDVSKRLSRMSLNFEIGGLFFIFPRMNLGFLRKMASVFADAFYFFGVSTKKDKIRQKNPFFGRFRALTRGFFSAIISP